MHIPVLLGTSRPGNHSSKVARVVVDRLSQLGHTYTLIKPEDNLTKPVTLRIGKETEQKTEWQQVMAEARGLLIVSPEYNHGFPGELKLMLDQLYTEYTNKPVAIVGVSDGGLGGARMVELLYPVLIALEMHPLKQAVYFSNVDTLFDAEGNLNQTNYVTKVDVLVQRLIKAMER